MVGLQRGVQAEYGLRHCVDEDGRELRLGRWLDGARWVSSGLQRCWTAPFYYILSSDGQEQGAACCRLQTDGMTMSRKRLLVEDAGMEKMGMVRVCGGVVFSACQNGERSKWMGVRKPLRFAIPQLL